MPGRSVLFGVLVLTFLPMAPAVEAGDLPLLASVRGPGWHSLKIMTDGAPVSYDARAYGTEDVESAGVMRFDGDGRWWGMGAGQSGGRSSHGYARLEASDTTLYEEGSDADRSAPGGWSGSMHVLTTPGVHYLLFWGTPGATFEVRGGIGATILGQDSGPGGFFLDERAFDGAVEARARDGYTGVRVNVGSTLTIDVQDSLFAYFDAGDLLGAPTEVIAVVTPKGVVPCPCSPNSFTGHGPGAYTFHLNGPGYDLPWSTVQLVGAVARLPT